MSYVNPWPGNQTSAARYRAADHSLSGTALNDPHDAYLTLSNPHYA